MNIIPKILEVAILAIIMVSLVILLGLFFEPSYTENVIEAVQAK